MQDDERFDAMLDAAARDWRVAPATPEDLWAQIEAEAFAPRVNRWKTGWRSLGLATAASLLIGIALGRGSVGIPGVGQVAANPDSIAALALTSDAENPFARSTEELLGRTALLLAALPDANLAPSSSGVIARQGGELLTTTRMLLDSPAGVDPKIRALLEDLELVLAQVARLRSTNAGDLDLINDALDRNEIVPRIRSAVIGSSEALN